MRSSTVMPHPPGQDWLCRTGHGFTISKNRKAKKTPAVSIQEERPKKDSTDGQTPRSQNRIAIQLRKHTGIATISSRTTEPGSFAPSSRSAGPPTAMESTIPPRIPPAKRSPLGTVKRRANQAKPTTEPKVPGATGIRPTPNPWASQSDRRPLAITGLAGKGCDCAKDKTLRKSGSRRR